MSEFFAMDGYASFIWPAYAIPVILMVVIWLVSQRGLTDSWRILSSLEDDLARQKNSETEQSQEDQT